MEDAQINVPTLDVHLDIPASLEDAFQIMNANMTMIAHPISFVNQVNALINVLELIAFQDILVKQVIAFQLISAVQHVRMEKSADQETVLIPASLQLALLVKYVEKAPVLILVVLLNAQLDFHALMENVRKLQIFV